MVGLVLVGESPRVDGQHNIGRPRSPDRDAIAAARASPFDPRTLHALRQIATN